VIRMSPYVRKLSPQPVHPTQKRTGATAGPTGFDARRSQSQPRSPPGPLAPSQPTRQSKRLMTSSSSQQVLTPRTDHEDPDDRRRREVAVPAFESWCRTQDDAVHSREQSIRYSPPTITVRSQSASHRDSGTAEMLRTDEGTGDRRSKRDRLGVDDPAARSTGNDERRHNVLVVREQLQTRNDTTTGLDATSVPRLHRSPSPAGMTRDDPETRVNVPLTTACKTLAAVSDAPQVSNDSDGQSTGVQTEEVLPLSDVADENLRLLEKLVSSGRVTLGGARMTVEVRKKCLRVDGSSDQIQAAKMSALETLSRVCCDRAGISQKQLALLTSDRGQRWFDDLLAQNGGPIVVLFTKDAADYIAGADDDVISHVKSLLKKSLSSETISIGPELSKFLQSSQWADAVEKYESSWFLSVTCDDGAQQVVVDGCAREVRDVVVEVRELLKQNSRMSRIISLKPGQYRLIRQHLEDEASQCVKNQRGYVLVAAMHILY